MFIIILMINKCCWFTKNESDSNSKLAKDTKNIGDLLDQDIEHPSPKSDAILIDGDFSRDIIDQINKSMENHEVSESKQESKDDAISNLNGSGNDIVSLVKNQQSVEVDRSPVEEDNSKESQQPEQNIGNPTSEDELRVEKVDTIEGDIEESNKGSASEEMPEENNVSEEVVVKEKGDVPSSDESENKELVEDSKGSVAKENISEEAQQLSDHDIEIPNSEDSPKVEEENTIKGDVEEINEGSISEEVSEDKALETASSEEVDNAVSSSNESEVEDEKTVNDEHQKAVKAYEKIIEEYKKAAKVVENTMSGSYEKKSNTRSYSKVKEAKSAFELSNSEDEREESEELLQSNISEFKQKILNSFFNYYILFNSGNLENIDKENFIRMFNDFMSISSNNKKEFIDELSSGLSDKSLDLNFTKSEFDADEGASYTLNKTSDTGLNSSFDEERNDVAQNSKALFLLFKSAYQIFEKSEALNSSESLKEILSSSNAILLDNHQEEEDTNTILLDDQKEEDNINDMFISEVDPGTGMMGELD